MSTVTFTREVVYLAMANMLSSGDPSSKPCVFSKPDTNVKIDVGVILSVPRANLKKNKLLS